MEHLSIEGQFMAYFDSLSRSYKIALNLKLHPKDIDILKNVFDTEHFFFFVLAIACKENRLCNISVKM